MSHLLALAASPEAWMSLLTLTALEIVLGIDNIIFLSIIVSRLPAHQRDLARRLGLAGALVMRIALLATITWIIGLTKPVFSLWDHDVSWRDIILIGGGVFLLVKATMEIHLMMEGHDGAGPHLRAPTSFASAIVQIMIIDLVFSLDSIITAVGMADELAIMIIAVCIAIFIMLVASGPVSAFIHEHPTAKMLALAFLLLVGMALTGDGMHFHIPRGYLYFAIAFSILVEALNITVSNRRRRRRAAEAAAEAGGALPPAH
ncbi:MAG: TerC family protein [Alphaproteobacteria bacterium]|nr:TerC family protein [Alphaproteobacteria bacterium]